MLREKTILDSYVFNSLLDEADALVATSDFLSINFRFFRSQKAQCAKPSRINEARLFFLHFPTKDQGTAPRKEKKTKQNRRTQQKTQAQCAKRKELFLMIFCLTVCICRIIKQHKHNARSEKFFFWSTFICMIDNRIAKRDFFSFFFFSQCASTENSKKMQ